MAGFQCVREAFARLAAQGWTDALRTLHRGERIYTFSDYFRNAFACDAGLRIDHLMLSPAAARGLSPPASTETSTRKTSDHAPTWIELALTR